MEFLGNCFASMDSARLSLANEASNSNSRIDSHAHVLHTWFFLNMQLMAELLVEAVLQAMCLADTLWESLISKSCQIADDEQQGKWKSNHSY